MQSWKRSTAFPVMPWLFTIAPRKPFYPNKSALCVCMRLTAGCASSWLGESFTMLLRTIFNNCLMLLKLLNRAISSARHEMFNIYIRRAAELYGITHTRPIYEVRPGMPSHLSLITFVCFSTSSIFCRKQSKSSVTGTPEISVSASVTSRRSWGRSTERERFTLIARRCATHGSERVQSFVLAQLPR